MKHLFTAISLFFSLVMSAQQYTISGTADGTVDGDTVFLARSQGYALVNTDTTIVAGGRFSFRGMVPAEGYAMRYVRPSHAGKFDGLCMASVVLEDADIKVHTFQSSPKYKDGEVSSTGVNHLAWEGFQESSKGYSAGMDDVYKILLYKTGTDEEQKIAQAKVDSVRTVMTDAKRRYLLHQMACEKPVPVCELMLNDLNNSISDAERTQLVALFKQKLPESAVYKQIMANLEASAPTAVGKKYTDFTMPDPDGKDMSISQFIGKHRFVFVDFWASWCGPCRAEMPHVLEAYRLYHERGLEIVGVSFDNRHENWVEAIANLQLPWPQMSDLLGWSSLGARLYNIRAIPANVLIDKDGKIIARDLRGQKLLDTLKELME